MLKYVAIVAGLLIMCVPDDASLSRFVVQAGVGLLIFAAGVLSFEPSTR